MLLSVWMTLISFSCVDQVLGAWHENRLNVIRSKRDFGKQCLEYLEHSID